VQLICRPQRVKGSKGPPVTGDPLDVSRPASPSVHTQHSQHSCYREGASVTGHESE